MVEYAVKGESTGFDVFEEATKEVKWVDIASNVCWALWLLIAGAFLAMGYWVSRRGWWSAGAYAIGVVLLLNSF